jgi:SAM-dependent methyltransferase
MADDIRARRLNEDARALNELGVTSVERWNFVEAPYRSGSYGSPLYASYDELRGKPAAIDENLKETIAERILTLVEQLPGASVLYFPLSMGRHVDHQILFSIGLKLSATGNRVRFYEDYPYAEAYRIDQQNLNWLPQTLPIAMAPKLKAISAYESQIRGLGGSVRNLEKRLRRFGRAVGGNSISERYWSVVLPTSTESNGKPTALELPFAVKEARPAFRDLGNFLKTFRWGALDEALPGGNGLCLDLGCGTGRHRSVIESKGYEWLGFDRADSGLLTLKSDAAALPLQIKSVAAVVAWQVFEYLEQPEKGIAEAARVLETGGVFCGSVSFLEPIHGHTYFNISPLILEKLLAQNGFGDIAIKPGLNGFALMLWTWLRRSGIPFADRLAIPAAFLILAPWAVLIFLISWLAWRVGLGSGHMMRWVSQTSTLEFAGHVVFSARKKACL